MANRIKGQEVSVQLVTDGNVESEITEIMDFEGTYEFEELQQGYLGQKADDVDYIFKVISGKFSAHMHNDAAMDYAQKILDKAQRKTPDLVFNIVGVFEFPDGTTRSMTITDCAFGNIPFTVGSRGDYVKVDFQFKSKSMLSVRN